MIAIISGSTGLTGALLLSKLLHDDSITQVVSVTRRPQEISHPKFKNVIVSDFKDLLQYSAELKGDFYFSCLGTTIKIAKTKENFRKVDFDAVVNLGKVAEMNQAKSLTVISANGANSHSSIFYNKVKGETEEALMKLKINRLIIMRPGLLMGERSNKRLMEEVVIKTMKVISSILPEKIEKTIATSIETLTERMLKEGKNTAATIKILNAVDI